MRLWQLILIFFQSVQNSGLNDPGIMKTNVTFTDYWETYADTEFLLVWLSYLTRKEVVFLNLMKRKIFRFLTANQTSLRPWH